MSRLSSRAASLIAIITISKLPNSHSKLALDGAPGLRSEPSEGGCNLKRRFAVDLLQMQRLLIIDTTVHCGPQPHGRAKRYAAIERELPLDPSAAVIKFYVWK